MIIYLLHKKAQLRELFNMVSDGCQLKILFGNNTLNFLACNSSTAAAAP